MTLTLDSNNPLKSLESQGYTCKVTELTSQSTFAVGGIRMPVSSSSRTRFRFALPEPLAIQVSFAPEKFRHKLIKVFKKELQLDDPEFDAAVYIDTDEQDRVAAFLAVESTRSLVLDIVGQGGQIAVGEKTLNVILCESTRTAEEDQMLAAMVVAAAVNFRFEPPA
jgi:hypothetical protein